MNIKRNTAPFTLERLFPIPQARKRNVIGSNIFNILCVIGVSASVSPYSFNFMEYAVNMQIMAAFSIALLVVIMPWRDRTSDSCRMGRLAGILFTACYLAYAIGQF